MADGDGVNFIGRCMVSSARVCSILSTSNAFMGCVASSKTACAPSCGVKSYMRDLAAGCAGSYMGRVPICVPFRVMYVSGNMARIRTRLVGRLGIGADRVASGFCAVRPGPIRVLIGPASVVGMNGYCAAPAAGVMNLRLCRGVAGKARTSAFKTARMAVSCCPSVDMAAPVAMALLNAFMNAPAFRVFPGGRRAEGFRFPGVANMTVSKTVKGAISVRFRLGWGWAGVTGRGLVGSCRMTSAMPVLWVWRGRQWGV